MSLIDKIKQYIKKDRDVELTSEEKEQQSLIIYDHIINELNKYEQELVVLNKLNKSKDDCEKMVEDKILSYIEENDDVLTIQNEDGLNIGMIAASLKLENVVLRSLDNYNASVQRDKNNENIGIKSACNRLEIATLKALDNHEASLQCDDYGCNIGMFAAECGLEEAVLKALDNKEACKQVDFTGENIGMYCAKSVLNKATLKALDNEEMSRQVSGFYCTMSYLIALYGMKDCLKKVLVKYPDTLETFSVGYSQISQNIQEAKRELENDETIEENNNNSESELENES